MENKSDEELVKEIQAGNVMVYEGIVKRYQRPLFVFLHHIISDPETCEDLVQETLINIYRFIERIDTSRKFSTYAFTVAKNNAFSYLRKYKRMVSLTKVDVEDEIDLYEEIIQVHDEARIKKALTKLRKEYKDVVYLYYYEDLSYEEISKRLNIALNTVRTHLRRGKDQLKNILEEDKYEKGK
ncbi:MAG TPA: RNA polymerase sigma factor [Patescibacteria group bacterium]